MGEKGYYTTRKENSKLNIQTWISICALILSLLLAIYTICERKKIAQMPVGKNFIYWVHGKDAESKTGNLQAAHVVLDKIGYAMGTKESDWDLFWSHEYPFQRFNFKSLRPHQMVNKYPGSVFITNKLELGISVSKNIPPSYRMPRDGDKLIKFVEANPEAMFIQKNNEHRGVKIQNITKINVGKEDSFVQEYVKRPLLIDGRKFDIGAYTVLTSVDPLRVYAYKADALLRFCAAKYYPFDPQNIDSYVISSDNYISMKDIPALAPYYNSLGFGMKESFNAYLRSQEKDPTVIWNHIDNFIIDIFLQKEQFMMIAQKDYQRLNFHELIRFEFVVNEDLHVFALEANSSPLVDNHSQNTILYEQVIFNTLQMVGAAKYSKATPLLSKFAEEQLDASSKNIAVWAEHCRSELCKFSCSGVCVVCRQCLTPRSQDAITRAYKEHINRRNCRRIYPPAMVQGKEAKVLLDEIKHLSPNNQMMHLWFQGKCNSDIAWCT